MIKQNKVFYNVVIDADLFFTIYDYLRFNPGCAKEYKIFSTQDFDNLTLEDWKILLMMQYAGLNMNNWVKYML